MGTKAAEEFSLPEGDEGKAIWTMAFAAYALKSAEARGMTSGPLPFDADMESLKRLIIEGRERGYPDEPNERDLKMAIWAIKERCSPPSE